MKYRSRGIHNANDRIALKFDVRLHSIYSGNGLSQSRRQPIIRTNNVLVHWCIYMSPGVDEFNMLGILPLSPPGWRGIVVTVRAGGCQTCGTHISVTAWWIFSVRRSMELSRPAVVHCYAHFPICPISVCPLAKNLSNQAALGPDFAEPISLEQLDGFIPFEIPWNCLDLYLCNIRVIRPWPLIFKVKFWKCYISGMGRPIDMVQKGCESIGC